MSKAAPLPGRLTIAHIAELSGVSTPTVSKVLNGRSDVAPATRERVERVIAEVGYVRNRAARALGKGHSGLIDFVSMEITSPYIGQIMQGLEETLESAGLSMVINVTHEKAPGQWLQRIFTHRPDGVILVLPDGQSGYLPWLQQSEIPFVLIDDRAARFPEIPSVGATNFAGGLEATRHLLSLGHRRIGAIGGLPFGSTRERMAGYRTALEEAGMPFDPELMHPGDFGVDSGMQAVEDFLRLPDPPTGIFAGNDLQALGVYKGLHKHRLRVPDDISVVGFDDAPIVDIIAPGLTTVRQPLRQMGALATRMLQQLMEGKQLDTPHVEVATTLIERESCGPPVRC